MYIRKDKRIGHLPDMKKVLLAEDDTRLGENGAESVILGYTEIPLLVSQKNLSLPLFDTTGIHAQKALEYAVSEKF